MQGQRLDVPRRVLRDLEHVAPARTEAPRRIPSLGKAAAVEPRIQLRPQDPVVQAEDQPHGQQHEENPENDSQTSALTLNERARSAIRIAHALHSTPREPHRHARSAAPKANRGSLGGEADEGAEPQKGES